MARYVGGTGFFEVSCVANAGAHDMPDDIDLKVKTARRRTNSVWEDDVLVEKLKRLWKEGLSASQVAAELGHGLSRNAVIAKIHRLGMQRRSELVRLKSRKRRKPRPFEQQKPKPPRISKPKLEWEPFVPGPDLVIPEDQRKGVIDLEEEDCRWPIGDPQKDDFSFCNHKAVPGLPYCEHHCRRAYLTKPLVLARAEAAKREPVDA